MNYSEILSRAWQIIWKHKVLWIFGILAGCANSGGGGGGGGNNNSVPTVRGKPLSPVPVLPRSHGTILQECPTNKPGS